jgi:hypothetical protein
MQTFFFIYFDLSRARYGYELAKSFRPISLTPFLLKTMERLVDQSIRTGPLKRYPLKRTQYAYQRGRSSESALHDLVSRIKSVICHKLFALGAVYRSVLVSGGEAACQY